MYIMHKCDKSWENKISMCILFLANKKKKNKKSVMKSLCIQKNFDS